MERRIELREPGQGNEKQGKSRNQARFSYIPCIRCTYWILLAAKFRYFWEYVFFVRMHITHESQSTIPCS